MYRADNFRRALRAYSCRPCQTLGGSLRRSYLLPVVICHSSLTTSSYARI
jgi:hypothetical protein